jgi:hypothetical protein
MNILLVAGLGCYSGGFHHCRMANWGALVCFCAGVFMLGAAAWFLRQAPQQPQ